METDESCSTQKNASTVTTAIALLATFLLNQAVWGQELPSTIHLSFGGDNDRNQFSSLEAEFSTDWMALFRGGLASSRIQYDENQWERTTTAYFGVRSNPLRDWVFDGEIEVTNVSELMKVQQLSLEVLRYFSWWEARIRGGWRSINVQITPALQTFLNTNKQEVKDGSPWWGLDFAFYPWKRWSFSIFFSKYHYKENLRFLTKEGSLLFNYDLETLNYATSLLSHVFGTGTSYAWKRYDLSAQLSRAENQYDSGYANTLQIMLGLEWSKRWYTSLTVGGVTSFTENEEPTKGSFSSLGITFSW